MVTFEQLWCEKYAVLAEASHAGEEERRAEDFLDVSRTICGLELRALTPRDLLHLDYASSPFIRGGTIGGEHVAQFLWQLCDPQPRGWLAERRFFRHCARLNYDDSVAQIKKFLDRTFADAPGGGGSGSGSGSGGKPIGTSFVAPLIVRIAAAIPSLTPPAIMDTPVSQLFQYQKILAIEEARKNGGKYSEIHTPLQHLQQLCLAEVNQLNAAPPEATETVGASLATPAAATT